MPLGASAGPLRGLFQPFIQGTTYGNKPLGYYPPSTYGYNLDTTSTGYYGGGSYTQFYNFGRGYGLSGFPEPMPGKVYYRDRPRDWSLEDYSRKNSRAEKENSWASGEPGAPADQSQAWLQVQLPANAELFVSEKKSNLTGPLRDVYTPPLKQGRVYAWKLQAQWQENGKARSEEQEVRFLSGEKKMVRFGKPVLPAKMP